jgi:hypothetical protein
MAANEATIQPRRLLSTAWTGSPVVSTIAPVRVLDHIKRLDDCFGDFLVRVICPCGAVRAELAPRMRCSMCGRKAAEMVAVARPRPRGVPKNPH